jgi:hypothetical protein
MSISLLVLVEAIFFKMLDALFSNIASRIAILDTTKSDRVT